MRISNRISLLALGATIALGAASPMSTLAGGDPAKAGSKPAAKPDAERKVWTNDDVAQLNPQYVAGAGKSATQITVIPSLVVTPEGPKIVTQSVASSIPEQDPAWYAQQLDTLQSELAGIQAREHRLRNFRSTGTGIQPGLELNAPVEGISTDNLIANLAAEHQALAEQIDTLQDLARRNGFSPGQLVLPEPSAAEQRAGVSETLRSANAQLNGLAVTEAVMQAQAAELHSTLQQPTPGFGGNMTTDLLNRLDNRAAQLQSSIDNADSAARALGIAPGDLR